MKKTLHFKLLSIMFITMLSHRTEATTLSPHIAPYFLNNNNNTGSDSSANDLTWYSTNHALLDQLIDSQLFLNLNDLSIVYKKGSVNESAFQNMVDLLTGYGINASIVSTIAAFVNTSSPQSSADRANGINTVYGQFVKDMKDSYHISSDQINEVTPNAHILSSKTTLQSREVYIENLVTAKLSDALGTYHGFAEDCLKSGITAAQIVAGIGYVNQSYLSSLGHEDQANYLINVIKLYAALNQQGLLQTPSMVQDLINHFAIEHKAHLDDFQNIPSLGTGLDMSSWSLTLSINFIEMGLALAEKQTLYSAYAPSVGVLGDNNRLALLSNMMSADVTKDLINFIDPLTLENANFAADTTSNARVAKLIATANNKIVTTMGWTNDNFFSTGMDASAFAFLNLKSAFLGLDLASSETVTRNYINIRNWNHREALLSKISGADVNRALVWAQDGANRSLFDAAYNDHILDGLQDWDSISSVLAFYAQTQTVAASRTNLLSLAAGTGNSLSAVKRDLLTSFVLNSSSWQPFANAFAQGQFVNLTHNTTNWGQVSSVLTNYNVALSAWSNLSTLLNSLTSSSDKAAATLWAKTTINQSLYTAALASGILTGATAWGNGTNDNCMLNILNNYRAVQSWVSFTSPSGIAKKFISSSDKLSAVLYFGDAANGSARRTAYDAAASANLLGGLITWGTLSPVVNNYSTLNALSWGNFPVALSRMTVPQTGSTLVADKKRALAYFADTSDGALRRAGYDACSSDLNSWGLIQPAIDGYVALAKAWTNFVPLLGSISTSSNKRALVSYFNDTTNGALRRAGYDMLVFGLSPALSSLSAITPIVNSYVLLSGTWGSDLAALLGQITVAGAGSTVSADKDAALFWAQDMTNQANFHTVISDTTHHVLTGTNTWAGIQAVVNNYITVNNTSGLLNSILGTGPSAVSGTAAATALDDYVTLSSSWSADEAALLNQITVANPGSTVAVDRDAALVWARTIANQAAFHTVFSDAHNVLTGTNTWSGIQTVISNYILVNNAGFISGLLGSNTGLSASGLLANYVTVASDTAHSVLTGATAGTVASVVSNYILVNNAGLINSLLATSPVTTGSAAATVLANYAALSSNASLPTMLSLLSSSSDKQAALAWAQGGNIVYFTYANSAGLLSGQTVWGTSSSGNMLNVLTQYMAIKVLSPGWSNLQTMLTSLTTAVDKRSAVAYFSDSVSGASRRAAYDAAKTNGLVAGMTTWATIQPVVDNVNSLFTGAVNQTTAMAWYLTGANQAVFNASLAIPNLFATVTDLTTVDSSGYNGYQRFVNALGSVTASSINTTSITPTVVNGFTPQLATARAAAVKTLMQQPQVTVQL